MTNTVSRITKLFGIGIGIAALTLLTGTVAFGQDDNTQNNKDKTRRAEARINPTTLGMELSISLGDAPGRAGNSLPITMMYSSKVWRTETYPYTDLAGFTEYFANTYYGEHSTSGWTNSLQSPSLEDTSIYKIIQPNPTPTPDPCMDHPESCYPSPTPTPGGSADCPDFCTFCWYDLFGRHWCHVVLITSPNGGSANGRLAQDTLLTNSYNIIPKLTLHLPDGSTHDLVSSEQAINVPPNQLLPPQTSYHSIDGSNLRLEINPQTNVGILYLPDGSHYEFSMSGNVTAGNANYPALKYVDRNGNKLTPQYNSATGLSDLVDTMGRTIPGIPKPIIPTDPTAPIAPVYYDAPGQTNQTRRYTFKWKRLADSLNSGSISSLGQLFTGIQDSFQNIQHNPVVLQEVDLPNGTSYQFGYNIYGEIEKITYPSGATERYNQQPIPGFSFTGGRGNGLLREGNRGVMDRYVSPDGTQQSEAHWQYSVPHGNFLVPTAPYRVITAAPDGTQTVRYLFVEPGANVGSGGVRLPSQLAGKEYEEDVFAADGTTRLRRTLTEYNLLSATAGGGVIGGGGGGGCVRTCINGPSGIASDNALTVDGSPAPYLAGYPQVTRTTGILFENGSSSALAQSATFGYDNYSNVVTSTGFGFTVLDSSTASSAAMPNIALGSALKTTETDYITDSNYTSKQMVSLPIETRLIDPNNPNNILARNQAVYDEPNQYYSMVDYGSTTGYQTPTGANATYRGLPTTKRTWNADANPWITTHTQFDNFGNVRKVWDSTGDQNRFLEYEYDPSYYYAYVTKTKAIAPDTTGVHGTTSGSEVSRTYDLNTGLLLSTTDANGQTASTQYDSYLRPIRVIPPSGGSTSEIVYNDDPSNLWIKSRQQIDDSNWAESTTFFDRLGRVIKKQTKDAQGDIFSEIRYDNIGRVASVSNPYRQGETVYWSKPRYDERERVVETFAPAVDGQTGASTGTVQFGISTVQNYVGPYVVSTDASGRKKRVINGVYGIARVDEATSLGGSVAQDLGAIDTPNQPTSYSYDIKGQLTRITQGNPSQSGQPVQNRYFLYDYLGRLIRVRQPEQTPNTSLATTGNADNNQWTAGFTYDVLGNVATVTDAKNTVITNSYDRIGRAIGATYSDSSTPSVEFFYDGTGLSQVPQYSRGQLTKSTNSVSEDRYTIFDNSGRVLQSQQITDGQTYNFQYKYNLSGGLVEETYPSGRISRNYLDSDGGLATATTKTANGLERVTASNFDYSATGNIRKMRLGNGLWESAQVNERMQLTQVGLGTSQTDKSLFKVDYEYGELRADASTVDTTKNIGMIARTTTTIPSSSFVQTYRYDPLNRLTEAKEKNGSTTNWQQTFGYDIFGNRTSFSQATNGTQLTLTSLNNPTIDPATNRFTTGQGYVYDLNGNLIQDAEGRTLTYDGNDKQTQVKDVNNNVVGQYYYDGSGARVKKVVPSTGETTVFVYDAAGALAAEYSTATPPANPQTSYMTSDHLGSARVITDQSGNVTSRRDFMPFGEEIYAGVGTRSTSQKYSSSGVDNVRQRYTGYQKDTETGLDFAEARMYENRHGRFTAPDPLLSSASPLDPQTFNRYTYTGNNPVNFTDPAGLDYYKDKDGNIKWFDDNPGQGWTNVTSTKGTVVNVGPEFTRAGAQVGDSVIYNANHTITVVPSERRAQQEAAATGTEIQAKQEEVTTSTAPSEMAGTITSRPLLEVPTLSLCAPGEHCGSVAPDPSNDLEPSHEGSKVVEGIARLAEGCSMIPGIGTACAAIAVITRGGQGDIKNGALDSIALIPFGGIVKRAGTVFKAAEEVAEGSHVVYQGFDRATGAVKYVGMTMRDPAIRFAEHAASGTERALLDFRIIDTAKGLTKIEARKVEQQLINKHGLDNLLNKINSVAPKYWEQLGIK